MNDDNHLLPDDEAELHAYVDGRLDAERHAAVRARLAGDEGAAARVRAWSQQRHALRTLHPEMLQEPVPAHLLQAAMQLDRRSSRFARWQRWGGMAAAVLLAFGLGWGGHARWDAVTGVRGNGPVAFVHQATAAYAVYLPEVRHPVEVEATQQQHLVQWLSKRLNRQLKVPNLAAAGYELVGGRLLPGDNSRARAQFMFQNAAGERVTLYIGAVDAAGAKGMDETAFRFTDERSIASFYWVDQGFGYALSGKLPRQTLLVLAEAVYKQL
ncbi:anti-sigma factor [Ramlibacter sp.]|jgi:anti-sigma factor RsiW|uniref:anti-sigma factor family protein n=1 Tax=Ramlibacter sp. TaxID=1917967 RepID=UPI002634E1B7|nr:anti-sigma factor [Ramlibacter sp.]MDB5958328.1 rseA2 [Ramlibacter sp.]